LKLWLIRVVMRMLSWITPRAGELIAPPLAFLIWHLSTRLRRVTIINLKLVFPEMDEDERYRMARASMTHYARGILEAGILWNWPVERIFDQFDEALGMEHYYDAKRAGKGVILAGVHAGSWEFLGLYMQKHLNGSILYKPGKHADVEEMLLEKRRRAGAVLIPASPSGLRTMFSRLKKGKTVALMPDQEPSLGEGKFAPFYGVQALTGVLLPRMAQRMDAKVLFAICRRLEGGRFQVHVFEAHDDIYDPDMSKAVAAVNRGMEQCIDMAPEQNLWAYKRFRNRPEGERSVYKK
jgi:KDO2-lipid IV(A) lauroyltransferase